MKSSLHALRAKAWLALAGLAFMLVTADLLPASAAASHAQVTSPARGKTPMQAAAMPGPHKAPGGDPQVVEIVAEGLGQTEFRIADEIATAVASGQESGPNGEYALRAIPVVSHGGIQAVRDVLTLPNADFGIVAAPILASLSQSGALGRVRDRIVYIAPLYVEEVHLLAGPGVHSLSDLQGQAVGIGSDESTTAVVAQQILARAGIRVREEHLDLRDALVSLKAGDLAAAFVVSGKPVDDLRVLTPADGLKLVPVTLPSLPDDLLPSTITADDYPQLVGPGERVATLGVQNVMIAYAWPPHSPRAALDELFLNSLFWHLSSLEQPPRHPKWQEVNLAGILPGWRRLPAMEAWLKKSGHGSGDQALRTEFDRFVTEKEPQAGSREREALFRDFLLWRNSPSTTGAR